MISPTKLTSKLHPKNEHGQAMVEFALVLPLLLLVVLAIFQFGITFKNYLALTDAVRAGARTAAVSRQEPNPAAKAEQRVREAGGDLNQSKLEVQVDGTFEAGTAVTVTASYPFEISLLGLVVTSGDLHSTTKERVE